MKVFKNRILTLNSGSSSIKFAVYVVDGSLQQILKGEINRIGLPNTIFAFNNLAENRQGNQTIEAANHQEAAAFFMQWLEKQINFNSVAAVGHRLVQGMRHTKTQVITPKLLKELHGLIPYDPDHLPNEIELIQALGKRHPTLVQIACFDTAFHQSMPRVAKILPIPRRFDAVGIQRYGFHGISYQFLIEKLEELTDKKTANGRIILAHLGNGASLAAVYEGKSVDTTMGFTPVGGVPMGSRPGNLDPGVIYFMLSKEHLSSKKLNYLINHECGLIGISETSSDMTDLLNQEVKDVRAAEAVALFCYEVKKAIGSLAAALGDVETLVFAGGIGENAPVIRKRICEGLEFLGIKVNENENDKNAGIISEKNSKVNIRIIATDEELMIAKMTHNVLSTKLECNTNYHENE